MASLRQIRRRIRTVEQTQKTTRAMEMVAASKLKRLERRLADRRPYTQGLSEVLQRHLAQVRLLPATASPRGFGLARNDASMGAGYTHPWLIERPVRRLALVVLASDRGLCGAYNINLFRRAEAFLKEWSQDRVGVIPIGKRAIAYFRRRSYPILDRFEGLDDRLPGTVLQEIAQKLTDLFESGAVDEVHLLSTRYLKMLSYRMVQERLLPLEVEMTGAAPELDAIYEPDAKTFLDGLVGPFLRARLGMALLEGFASEQSHRMFAMRQATENADEMIHHLTLLRNKIRQAVITKEIAEIVGGAEALK